MQKSLISITRIKTRNCCTNLTKATRTHIFIFLNLKKLLCKYLFMCCQKMIANVECKFLNIVKLQMKEHK